MHFFLLTIDCSCVTFFYEHWKIFIENSIQGNYILFIATTAKLN